MPKASTSKREGYCKVKDFLNDLNINRDLINYLDRLGDKQKEEFSLLLTEIVEDESSHVLAILDKSLFKEYLEDQRMKKRKGSTSNIVHFPIN